MKSRECSTQLNRLEFHGKPLPVNPNFTLALHYKKPEGGNQSSHELSDVPGYMRLLVPRDAEHWLVEGPKVINAKSLVFQRMWPQKKTIITHTSLGVDGLIWHVFPMGRPAEVYDFASIAFFPGDIWCEDDALELIHQPEPPATAIGVFSGRAKSRTAGQSFAKGRSVEAQA